MVRREEARRGAPGMVAALVAGGMLASCTTTSFAPPPVNTEHPATSARARDCRANVDTRLPITRDVNGAQGLIDNFILVYRCSSHEAADGRQIFEVPSLLALVTAAIGPTFGLSQDGVIAAATGAAVYGRANTYYAPKEKARVIDTALDAVLCIKSASVGFEAFDTRSALNPEVRASMEAHLNAEIARVQGEVAQAKADKQQLEGELTKAQQDLAKAQQDFARADAVIRAYTAPNGPTPAETQARDDARTAANKALAETLRLPPVIAVATTKTLQLESQLAEYQSLLDQLGKAPGALTGDGARLTMSLAGNASVEIDVGRQYFEMVATSLYSVERILAQRMSNIGTFDSAGIAAQFAQLAKQQSELPTPPVGFAALTKDERADSIKIQVQQMRNELQTCVLRAKV